ncbi:MAG: anti-sigma factor [Bacteroidia bacterium]|nr:anti-sigma factor [Bacteroidia bacterium]NND26087.1 anti-sigma factor [Flavobacteriaceae bacterium]MBT8278281.1 anti-sigma factor [Bacteroidia bacterium]NNK60028.1 anti-sigma factor [Flavobacteriaceae bacterium]NNL32938.1 anti-sigma factor [Flavobacteriaceae bacterium]
MEPKVQEFLNSGLLDKYINGFTLPNETLKVEQYIAQFPEVKEEYNLLQDQLEISARSQAVEAPDLLGVIMDEINEKTIVKLEPKSKSRLWMSIAASVAALVFAGTSFIYYNQNKSLMNENDTIAEEIFDLRSDIEKNNDMLDNVMRQLMKLNNPETQKYVLRGNDRAKDLKTVAYINPIEKSSLIDVVELPKLSNEQCYQMWAQMNDKMVNLGILDEADRNLKPIPYIEDALSLSITIEPKGGNKNAKIENAVAKIPLNIKNN